MITLQKIATICGVSVATVSKALRAKPGVKPDVRERIMSVAKQHNYSPNRLVHAIQSGRSMTVGVLCSHFGEEFSGAILDSTFGALEENQYDIMVTNWDRNAHEIDRVLQRFMERRVDGILMFPPAMPPSSHSLGELQAFSCPIIVVDQTWPGCRYDFIGSQDFEGALQLTNHLIELGHQEIANIHYSHSSTGRKRLDGFKTAMMRHGATIRERWLKDIHHYDSRECYTLARELLMSESRPTAIMTFNDIVAIQTMAAASDLGLRIPEDVSITGFADLGIARELRPRLTTIAQNPDIIGKEAAKRLLERIQSSKNTEQEPALEKLVNVSLQIRDTTAPPIA